MLNLLLFVDADFARESDNAKSTSGGFLVLAGPNSWFPLTWLSKRQSCVSRSTTEAEVVSLAASLHTEAIPMLDLWDLILGRKVPLFILESNQATMKVLRKGFGQKLRSILGKPCECKRNQRRERLVVGVRLFLIENH